MTELSINIISAMSGVVATALIGGIAYFIKRHIEHKDKAEIEHFLDGYERLNNISGSNNPPRATEQELRDISNIVNEIRNNINFTNIEEDTHYDGALTQADMNRIGGAKFAEADAIMNATYTQLMAHQDGSCAEALDDALSKWKEFRHEYAVFIAEAYSGGSIQNLMYTNTAVEITNQFNDLLSSQIELESQR